MEFIKPGTNVDFVGKRKAAFVISALLIIMTVASLVYHGGPNYGVDFAGGILIQASFEKPTNADQIRAGLEPIGLGEASIQTFGAEADNEFIIRAQQQDGMDMSNLGDKVKKALETALSGQKVDIRRVDMVGPKVGADLREKALLALFVALLFIAVYISGRFQMKWVPAAFMAGALGLVSYIGLVVGMTWTTMIGLVILVTLALCWFLRLRYALGAVVALLHDVIITVGIFSITGKEFTLAIVAALLAIIGYSLNDTIIVFDRIRETILKSGKMNLGSVLNRAINDTLSRTILTSLTTLLVVVSLVILGGGVIHDFAFALTIGVLVGTYSSIFVASPVLLLFPEERVALKAQEKAAAPAVKAAPQAEKKVGPKPTAAQTAQIKPKKKRRKKKKKK